MTSALLQRVQARLVRPEWAERVVSPAYDMLRPQQRHELMEKDPYVFLHVTRSLGDDQRQTISEEVSVSNAEALIRLLEADVYEQVRDPSLYLYQLRSGDHQQTGVIGDISLQAVEEGKIIPHERTRPHRSMHLADHLERIGIHSSPVALGYEDDDGIASIVDEIKHGVPLLDFQREDMVQQTIWMVPDNQIENILTLFRDKKAYVVDGHHRVSAALEMWNRTGKSEKYGSLLIALFPLSDLKIRPFHRRVGDVNGHSVEDLYQAIASQDFTLTPLDDSKDPNPKACGEFSMYVNHQWISLKPSRMHPSEIDSGLLQKRILGPIFNIDEAEYGDRLDYLPGNSGLSYFVNQTDQEGGVVFALHPVPLTQLISVADRGKTFPPKSTYFAPKVRSGIFIAHR
ncbi:MAG: DUF1015 family protein [Acidimicrobiales bacterium]|nr:DUF1015 family protein [Acidimicrobiales bacterium]